MSEIVEETLPTETQEVNNEGGPQQSFDIEAHKAKLKKEVNRLAEEYANEPDVEVPEVDMVMKRTAKKPPVKEEPKLEPKPSDPEKKGNNSAIIIVVVLIIVAAICFVIWQQSKSKTNVGNV